MREYRFSSLRASILGVVLLTALVAGLSAPAVAQPVAGGNLKIAVVDLDLIVARSPAGQALQGQLEAFQKQAQGEGDAMQAAARDIRQRIADGVNSLTEEKLAQLQKEYEDKMIEIRRFRDDKQREGQKMQNEGLQQIEKQLEPVFEKIRDDNGYDLILNRVPGVVVMAGSRIDITQQVIDALGNG